MPSPTWNSRRHVGRIVTGALALAMLAGLGIPRASADPLGSARAQATQLLTQIQTLGQQEDALSERYDQATVDLQTAQARVSQANEQLKGALAQEGKARQALTADAVTVYEDSGSEAPAAGHASTQLSAADQAMVEKEYEGTLANAQSDDLDQYHLLALQATDAEKNLQQAQTAAQNTLDSVNQDRQSTAALAAKLQQDYGQVQGQVATLFNQEQAQQQAAQQQAAQQRLAAARTAAAQHATAQLVSAPKTIPEASTSGLGTTTSTSTATTATTATAAPRPPTFSAAPARPPVATAASPGPTFSAPLPQGSGVGAAISAAESQIGVPYVYGGESAGQGFDCSGLVQWSFARAGISLPRTAAAQYGAVSHITMGDLEPGDLVFFGDLSHVAIYIGNGEIVEAPHTGASVWITALYPEFVLAGRVT